MDQHQHGQTLTLDGQGLGGRVLARLGEGRVHHDDDGEGEGDLAGGDNTM